MPLDTYLEYYRACQRSGTTPLSREWYTKAIAAERQEQRDTQYDYDTEKREGWAND